MRKPLVHYERDLVEMRYELSGKYRKGFMTSSAHNSVGS